MTTEEALGWAGGVLVYLALRCAEGFLGEAFRDLKRHWQKRGER
jgi:hypothetical protein